VDTQSPHSVFGDVSEDASPSGLCISPQISTDEDVIMSLVSPQMESQLQTSIKSSPPHSCGLDNRLLADLERVTPSISPQPAADGDIIRSLISPYSTPEKFFRQDSELAGPLLADLERVCATPTRRSPYTPRSRDTMDTPTRRSPCTPRSTKFDVGEPSLRQKLGEAAAGSPARADLLADLGRVRVEAQLRHNSTPFKSSTPRGSTPFKTKHGHSSRQTPQCLLTDSWAYIDQQDRHVKMLREQDTAAVEACEQYSRLSSQRLTQKENVQHILRPIMENYSRRILAVVGRTIDEEVREIIQALLDTYLASISSFASRVTHVERELMPLVHALSQRLLQEQWLGEPLSFSPLTTAELVEETVSDYLAAVFNWKLSHKDNVSRLLAPRLNGLFQRLLHCGVPSATVMRFMQSLLAELVQQGQSEESKLLSMLTEVSECILGVEMKGSGGSSSWAHLGLDVDPAQLRLISEQAQAAPTPAECAEVLAQAADILAEIDLIPTSLGLDETLGCIVDEAQAIKDALREPLWHISAQTDNSPIQQTISPSASEHGYDDLLSILVSTMHPAWGTRVQGINTDVCARRLVLASCRTFVSAAGIDLIMRLLGKPPDISVVPTRIATGSAARVVFHPGGIAVSTVEDQYTVFKLQGDEMKPWVAISVQAVQQLQLLVGPPKASNTLPHRIMIRNTSRHLVNIRAVSDQNQPGYITTAHPNCSTQVEVVLVGSTIKLGIKPAAAKSVVEPGSYVWDGNELCLEQLDTDSSEVMVTNATPNKVVAKVFEAKDWTRMRTKSTCTLLPNSGCVIETVHAQSNISIDPVSISCDATAGFYIWDGVKLKPDTMIGNSIGESDREEIDPELQIVITERKLLSKFDPI